MASNYRLGLLGLAVAAFGCAWIATTANAADAEAEEFEGEEEVEAQEVSAAPVMSLGETKFWEAMKWFRSKAPADLAAGRAALEASAAAEFTHAQLFLGECYQTGGYGYERNVKKAAANMRLAAERGNAFARVSHGLMLFSGIGVRKDEEKAFEWLNAALADGADYSRPQPPADFFVGAEAGADEGGVAGAAAADPVASAKARAHFFLGMLSEKRKDGAGAQAHFVAAARAGVAGRDGVMQAATQAAVNYALGRGVPRDAAKAKEMLEQSRKLGRHARISLLHNYATAKLVDDFAVSELEEALAKASDEAEGEMQMNIARMLTDRKSKDYNPQEAVTWFELAAESGKPWAMLELAFLYTRGDLGQPEPEKAFAWFQRASGEGEKEVKHYLAIANLVISLQHGIGTEKDVERAKAIAMKHRDDELVSYLTTVGQCPTKVVTFEQWVELNKRWAKEKKDAHAQYLMGMRSESGSGVRQHMKDALSWYRKAVKQNHPRAARRLGQLHESFPEALSPDYAMGMIEAARYYRIGAEGNDAKSVAFLASMMSNGRGMAADETEAIRLYEKSLALDPELSLAMNNLGTIYQERFERAKKRSDRAAEEKNRELMLSYYEKADAKEDAHGAYNLAGLHYEGSLGKKDLQKAYALFETAAERGHVDARFRLGRMHEKGEGVPETPVEAAYHYRLAALDGHREALERLVSFYLQGKGGAQDIERAQFWLARMFAYGDVAALAKYADLAQQQGKHKEAVKLFKLLLKGGGYTERGIAFDRLSRCYREGLGVKRNVKRADKYRTKALEHGCADTVLEVALEKLAAGKPTEALSDMMGLAGTHAAAAFEVGDVFYRGRSVQKDPEKGLSYLKKAGEMGHAKAMYTLAELALSGAPGAPELEEAIKLAKGAEAVGILGLWPFGRSWS